MTQVSCPPCNNNCNQGRNCPARIRSDTALKQMRDQIAAEIAEKFGNLAPYTLVQNFVRTGPQKGTTDAKS